MGWSLGHDSRWGKHGRDIGYGVVAYCDHPGCNKVIDRGLAHVCCNMEPYGGECGCGLYFCSDHASPGNHMCERCVAFQEAVEVWEALPADTTVPYPRFEPFHPKPDHPRWVHHKLTDPSWMEWREAHPDEVAELQLS